MQNRKDPHKISFSEPVILLMKFPTCALVDPDQLASDDASWLRSTLLNILQWIIINDEMAGNQKKH